MRLEAVLAVSEHAILQTYKTKAEMATAATSSRQARPGRQSIEPASMLDTQIGCLIMMTADATIAMPKGTNHIYKRYFVRRRSEELASRSHIDVSNPLLVASGPSRNDCQMNDAETTMACSECKLRPE